MMKEVSQRFAVEISCESFLIEDLVVFKACRHSKQLRSGKK
jgi:hypothetical protein